MRAAISCLILAFLCAGCEDQGITIPVDDLQSAVATPTASLHRVVGGGSVVREDLEGSPRETYGFQAELDVAGRVTGQAEVHFPVSGLKMHIDIRCMAVEGQRAWLSGRVTRSDRPDFPRGMVFLWQVEDVGERKGPEPDRISNFVYGSIGPQVCRWKPELETFAWDVGGVEILTPGALGVNDLVGTWDATTYLAIDFTTLADTLDVLSGDQEVRWTVAPDGHWSIVWWVPGEILENVAGTLDVVDGQVVLTAGDEDPPVVLTGPARRLGQSLFTYGDYAVGHDWNGDGEEDPSRIIQQWTLKRTGVLIDDLAGTWQATVWRYASVADPSVIVDKVAEGVAVTMIIGLDSRYTVIWDPGPTNMGEILVEGDQLLARNGESRALTYSLTSTTLSFWGDDAYDFDGDGSREPAVLETSLVRQ